MLVTAHKSKLPGGWSYPVGAQVLSDWLEHIEGAGHHAVYFSDSRVRNTRYRRKCEQQDVPYVILEVGYSRARVHGLALQSWGPLDPTQPDYWTVRIDAVPQEKAEFVRRCVATEALPRIRHWLEQTRAHNPQHGRGFCRLLFDEGRGRLLLEQRANDFEDPSREELPCSATASPSAF